MNPPKTKKWSIAVIIIAASILGMAWYGRSLHEIMLVLQSSANSKHSHPESTVARREEFWERTEESKCFHLDNVCNWKDGWFYGPNQGRDHYQAAAYQPTVTLLGTMLEDVDILEWNDLNDFHVDERIQVNISSDSHHMYDKGACSFSPTPNHLVAQSAYNEMMGEFYVRTIRGLNRWMRDYPQISEDDVQMYVHFVEKYDMFEGHRLFLAGLPNNNRFESFVSLMPRNDDCRCFRKLIFCGYHMEYATTFLHDIHSRMIPRGNFFADNPLYKQRILSKIHSDNGNAIVFKPHPLIPNPVTDCDECRNNAYRELRSDLMKTHSERYKDLDEKIQRYKRIILIEMGLVSNNTIDTDGWKFVGFARRKSRRLWLNIDDVMSMCNGMFGEHKVACVIVDVEEAESPEEQLIMHRSLDGLIGVHGAQLTQGVLLPTHGYILELLPWIPSYTGGRWTASTESPTPLGEIFHNIDINHYGYSLGRESTPLCLHVNTSDENGTRSCLTNEENEQKFNWDVRDFIVPVNIIEDFLSTILQHGDNATCDAMKTRAEERNFVLYNAFCRQSVDQASFVTQHYYRHRRR
jgi:hypothetical protein